MNIITKSAIGLALTGGATTGIVFATLPAKEKKPIRSREEIFAERATKKERSFKVLANLFNKHKSNNKELGEIISGTESGAVIFQINEEGNFFDSGSVDSTLITWCANNNWDPSLQDSKEYEKDLKRDKDAICAFTKVVADTED